MNTQSIKDWFKQYKSIISYVFAIVIIVGGLTMIAVSSSTYKRDNYSLPYSLYICHRDNLLHLQQIKYSLVTETRDYIKKIAPGTCLNALVLVESCDEYDIDLIFVLAQGQIESHYGTRGVASRTNSVFNVYSFDGLTADQINKSGRGYEHPDFSVHPYLELLRRRYLVDGKTERDMFNSFVDVNGNRYASADNYEQSLMNTYLKIASETKIDSLLTEYRKFKIITHSN